MEEQPKKFYNEFLSKKEKEYDQKLKKRLEDSRDERNESRDEFDNLDYISAYDRDTKTALAFIPSTKNEGENPISTGTSRQSLISLISRAISYNYQTEFRVFNKNNEELTNLSRGLEIAVSHANFLDNDDDYVKTRAFELLAHGDVFIWEDWVKEWGTEKSIPKFDGKVSGVNWTERKKVVFEGCRRKTIQGRRFYFGDIFTEGINNQPFNFMANHITGDEAKMNYEKWERFKHVPHVGQKSDFDYSNYAEDWRIEKDAPNGTICETIYVSKARNEMQIWLNGVPMLPMGYPMKWEHGKYPWAQVGAEPIRAGFAYHRSFIRTLQNMQELENDMWRVLIMLAWKAAMPPLANDTGQVITRKQIMAGQILDGISADDLKPINDGSLNNLNYVQNIALQIRDNMTSRSVPESKQGSSPDRDQTATAVTQLNKEAEIAISMNLSAIAKISSKADWLRAGNILQHAFKDGFKATSENVGSGGVTRHILEVTKDIQDSETLKKREENVEKRTGKKNKILQLKPDVKSLMDSMYAIPVPRPKASSALDKIELQNMSAAAAAIFGPEFNKEFLEDEYRRAYRVSPDTPLLIKNPMPAIPQGSPPKPAQPLPNQLVNNDIPA